jgi:hypothetical protein
MYINTRYSNIHPLYKTEKGATVILCLVVYFWFNKHINHEQRVLMHFLTTRIKSLKIIFERLECFYAFAHNSRPQKSSPKKIILFTSGVVKNVF